MGALIAAGVSAVSGVVGSIANANAANAAAEGQVAAAEANAALGAEFTDEQLAALGITADTVRSALDKFEGSFRRTPNATEFIDDAIGLEQKGFDFMTGIKRENLDFILGDSYNDLRSAQSDFTQLAAGDFTAFKSELNASLNRANAEAFGSPVGTTFNIAARDRLNFRTAGLNNAMGINDFFAAEGTVDPPNPVTTSFGLAEFEQAENAREEQHNQFLLGSTIDAEMGLFNAQLGVSTVGLNAATGLNNTIGSVAGASQAANASLANGIGQAAGSLYGIFSQRDAVQQQQANFDLQQQNYADRTLAIGGGNFIPS